MANTSFKAIKSELKKFKNILIVTHYSPDGDAMGSSLALYHYLISLNKKVTVAVPNEYPDFLKWLPGNNKVLVYTKEAKQIEKLITKSDCIFTLDFNTLSRLEEFGKALQNCNKPFFLIDHHQQPDNYAKYKLHNVDACSTCELIYDFIVGLGDKTKIDKKIANCLYTGLMTDTGSFRYPSVNTKTHAIIAELLKTKIVPSDIHAAVYDNYSYDRLKLLGYCLSEKLKLINNNKVAYFSITTTELQQFNFKKGDTEGLVNYPFSISGVKVCAFFNEAPEGYIKISFRSKGNIDVNKFARKYFNGGGHKNAAGGKSNKSLKDTVADFEKNVVELC